MQALTPTQPTKKKRRPPWVLLPYQRRWLADKSRVKVYQKSRRIGISWATAAGAALSAGVKNGAPGWYVGYNAEMAMEYISDVGKWAKRFNLVAGCVKEVVLKDEDENGNSNDILAYRIRFASGFDVTALSSRPRNLRGKAGDVVIDEAAFHDDFPGLMKSANALLMWGGTVSIISTPNGVDSTFNRYLNDIAAGRRTGSVHQTTIDEALAEGLYRRICLDQGRAWSLEAENDWRAELFADYGDDAQEELLCIPARSGGIYISRGLIEAAMYPAPVLQLAQTDAFVMRSDEFRRADTKQWCDAHLLPLLNVLPKAQEHYLGIDFGRVDDLSVIATVTLEKNMTRKFPFIVELRNVPFLEQDQIASYILDRLPRLGRIACDSTGNGQFLGERMVQRYGDTVAEAIHMSQAWYAQNLPKLKAAFEDQTIKIPRDSDIASDLASYRVIDGVPRLPKLKVAEHGDKTKTRHGDAAIAIALAYYASCQGRMTVDYRPVKPSLGANGTPATMRTKRGAFG